MEDQSVQENLPKHLQMLEWGNSWEDEEESSNLNVGLVCKSLVFKSNETAKTKAKNLVSDYDFFLVLQFPENEVENARVLESSFEKTDREGIKKLSLFKSNLNFSLAHSDRTFRRYFDDFRF